MELTKKLNQKKNQEVIEKEVEGVKMKYDVCWVDGARMELGAVVIASFKKISTATRFLDCCRKKYDADKKLPAGKRKFDIIEISFLIVEDDKWIAEG